MKNSIKKFITMVLLSSAAIASGPQDQNPCASDFIVTSSGVMKLDDDGYLRPIDIDEENELINELEKRKLLGITCSRDTQICL